MNRNHKVDYVRRILKFPVSSEISPQAVIVPDTSTSEALQPSQSREPRRIESRHRNLFKKSATETMHIEYSALEAALRFVKDTL
jgi:hypothetical protein